MKHRTHSFQEVEDLYFKEDLRRHLLGEFSELSFLDEQDGYYEIANHLYRLLIENSLNDHLIQRVIIFLNQAFEKGKHETENLLVIELYEGLEFYPSLVKKMTHGLSGKALTIFLRYIDSLSCL